MMIYYSENKQVSPSISPRTISAETTNPSRDCTIFPVRIIAAPDPKDASRMIVKIENISAKRQHCKRLAKAINLLEHK
jgi:hypothetical protein